MMNTELPLLRPRGRYKAYYDELRVIGAAIEPLVRVDVLAYKNANNGKITTAQLALLALKYRLKLAALCTLLEDFDLLKCGTYDRMTISIMTYSDGTTGRFAPMRIFREVIARHGLPDAAPGCEAA